MDHHAAISHVLGTLTQLASPSGWAGAKLLPVEAMRAAFGRFVEYAEGLDGDENIDAPAHRRVLPFIRALTPLLSDWALDAIPRDVIVTARAALDAWFPERGGPDFWAQTDRDAESAQADNHGEVLTSSADGSDRSSADEDLLRRALGLSK